MFFAYLAAAGKLRDIGLMDYLPIATSSFDSPDLPDGDLPPPINPSASPLSDSDQLPAPVNPSVPSPGGEGDEGGGEDAGEFAPDNKDDNDSGKIVHLLVSLV